MLYSKNSLGRKYTRLLTGSPIFFLSYVTFGVVLFLFLTLNTTVEIVETYPAEVVKVEGDLALVVKQGEWGAGRVFVYVNKNETVYPVQIMGTENVSEGVRLQLDSSAQEHLKVLADDAVFIDVAKGRETLLYRIFLRGGKGRG